MAVQSLQYNSFLGGEVSPRLQYRTDMDKFGKWFKTAENIRFHTIGSFENRPGFAKVADTKRNITGEVIKLISFSFNDEESFLLEFGEYKNLNDKGYLRVFKNGKPVLVDGVPYEIESPLKIEKESDIKYIQSGDVIFITDGNSPLQELRRLKTDGTEWEFKQFEFNDSCLPLDEENTEKEKTLTTQKNTSIFGKYTFSFSFDDVSKRYKSIHNPVIKIKKTDLSEETLLTYTGIFTSLDNFISYINTYQYEKYRLTAIKTGESIQITLYGDVEIYEMSIDSKYVLEENEHEPAISSYYVKDSGSGADYEATYYFYNQNNYIPNTIKFIRGNGHSEVYPQTESDIIKIKDSEIIALGSNFSKRDLDNFYVEKFKDFFNINDLYIDYTYNRNAIKRSSGGYFIIYQVRPRVWGSGGDPNYYSYYKVYGFSFDTYKKTALPNELKNSDFSVLANFNFFKNKLIGETFAIRKVIDSHNYSAKQNNTSGYIYSDELIGTGSWRCWTEGNWEGEFKLQYSVDNGINWTTFYEFHNNDVKKPRNPNVSGEIDGVNGICLIRAAIRQHAYDTYAMDMDLEHKGGEIYSYFKIKEILSDTEAICECVKNNIGIFSSSYWRESVFSSEKGYPKALAFYQNRLFMSKRYQLYGSKTNDFWEFYEPIEVADDDPITMSLLSYRVNNIKNITSIRSFFVFTQGGEFGISAEGALTQANKYLKQFSTHGSADCLPIVVGSAVIFVEKSANRVRALQYSFESDNYEAEDISVLMEELLEKETIITTEYLPNTHEILFLAESGIIWVLKFYPEQNIFSWSHWKHAKGKITNICVVPHGSEDDLYIAVDTETGKQIEILNNNIYLDSKHEEEVLGTNKLLTPYINTELYLYDKDNNFIKKENTDDNGYLINNESKLYCWWGGAFKYFFKSLQPKIGDEIYSLDADNNLYKVNGNITNVSDDYLEVSISTEEGFVATVLRGGETYDIDEAYAYFNYGLPYTSTATLLSPEITLQDGNNSVYHKKRPFKVHYVYKNSYGFKIGVEDNEKMEPEWQKVDEIIDNERELTSGKKAILVPARYDGTSRVSFVQDEPYPMIVENINIEVDYGGK